MTRGVKPSQNLKRRGQEKPGPKACYSEGCSQFAMWNARTKRYECLMHRILAEGIDIVTEFGRM